MGAGRVADARMHRFPLSLDMILRCRRRRRPLSYLPGWADYACCLSFGHRQTLASSARLWTPGDQSNSIGAIAFALSGLALVALVAPLVGYRRRDWLLVLIPYNGLVITYILGARLAELTNKIATPDSEWLGSPTQSAPIASGISSTDATASRLAAN
jgi:hypothetical protein